MPRRTPWSVFALAGAAATIVACYLLLGPRSPVGVPTKEERRAVMPHYQHFFVIVAENKSYDQIFGEPDWAPAIHKLAAQYGSATHFYSEVHPSEGNYVAMLGGDTFGIHDDDAFYCRPGRQIQECPNADEPGYVSHDIAARSLMDQLTERGLSWKAYMEDFPAAKPLATIWPSPDGRTAGHPFGLYVSKHNAFLNFSNINRQAQPEIARHIVSLSELDADLARNTVPNYAQIIPNQCNDMHGLTGAEVPPDCSPSNLRELVRRGDAEIGMLVTKITRSKSWNGPGNAAIIITFDESDGSEPNGATHGCCGSDPTSVANFGGGHIPTIVITNHGPRHLADATPYNHYSLLRSTEAAFGIREYLGRAANTGDGVITMAPLFAVSH